MVMAEKKSGGGAKRVREVGNEVGNAFLRKNKKA
jgi:hypothetical protein